KQEGDEIVAGDVIAEIETDKATMEVEAVDEGRLGKILVPEGTEGVPVNQPIAILLEEGEDESALEGLQQKPAVSAPEEKREERAEAPRAEIAEPVSAAATPSTPAAAAPATSAGQEKSGERIFVSPLARRMAEQAGLDLRQLKGSGPKGRIGRASCREREQHREDALRIGNDEAGTYRA